jgi:hypothetical protein
VRLDVPLEVAEADAECFGSFLPGKQEAPRHQAAAVDLA